MSLKQQRNTRQRQLVLDVVRGRRDHPTAEQIYQSVREDDYSVQWRAIILAIIRKKYWWHQPMIRSGIWRIRRGLCSVPMVQDL